MYGDVPANWVAVITPKGEGTTTITATLSNGVSKSFNLAIRTGSIDISADSRAEVRILNSETFIYNGRHQRPHYRLSYNGSVLYRDVDYKLVFRNDVNAGTGTVVIRGLGAYSGEIYRYYTIAPANIKDTTITQIANQVYTGSEIKPVPSVTFDGEQLVAGKDYDVTYADNIKMGTAAVTLTGKGNFTGTKVLTFSILGHFVDVPKEMNHAEDIYWLYDTGISQGWSTSDGRAEFRPYASVARADMAAFLRRLDDLA